MVANMRSVLEVAIFLFVLKAYTKIHPKGDAYPKAEKLGRTEIFNQMNAKEEYLE